MVEATGSGLFLYRPVAWCFFRGMKKHKAPVTWWKKNKALIISISIAFVPLMVYLIPVTNFWATEVEYYKDGSKYRETPYRFFTLHGTEIEYREDGSKWTETPYVNGERHGTAIDYYEDGSKRSETPYLNGKIHGTAIDYYEDGSKRSETPYLNGKRHGTAITYNEDGSKSRETPYVDGKRHGKYVYYNMDGSNWTEEYKENKVVAGTKMARRFRGTTKTDRRNGKSHSLTAKGMVRRFITSRTDRRNMKPPT